MRYAFLGAGAACEVLRCLPSEDFAGAKRWPPEPRRLPSRENCVSNQREAKAFLAENDLLGMGVISTPIDLLVSSKQARSSGKVATFHVWSGNVFAGACIRLGDSLVCSGPEFVVLQACASVAKLDGLLEGHAAAVQAEREALAITGGGGYVLVDHPVKWEQIKRLVGAAYLTCEFCGTYRLSFGEIATNFHATPLMSLESLREAAAQVAPSVAYRRGIKVVDLAFGGAASPMEASLALLLTLPVDYGGFGIKKPQLNACVDLTTDSGLSRLDVVRPDFLWADERVALEYDSAQFHEGVKASPGIDATRWNALTAAGYRVFRATERTVRALTDVTELAVQIAHALGVKLEEPSDLQALRRQRLFAFLMPRSLEAV